MTFSRRGVSREARLLALLALYVGLAALSVRLGTSTFTYGVSTLMSTSLVALTTLRSTVASSLFSGLNVDTMISNALGDAQILITILCIALLACIEVANPSFGGSSGFLVELRRSWLATLAIVLVLFAVTLLAKVLLFPF